MADHTLLSLSDLKDALKKKGLSISGKTLQRRSDEMGLAFGYLNGQRVYRPRDVPRIAERLSHYRIGNLPKRGRPKETLTLLSLPLDQRRAELGIPDPQEAGGGVGLAFHDRCPILSDDDLTFYGGLAADARCEHLAGKGCFSKAEMQEDRGAFVSAIKEAYHALQEPVPANRAALTPAQKAMQAGIAPPEAEGRLMADDLYSQYPMMAAHELTHFIEGTALDRAVVLLKTRCFVLSEVAKDTEVFTRVMKSRYEALSCQGPARPEDVN